MGERDAEGEPSSRLSFGLSGNYNPLTRDWKGPVPSSEISILILDPIPETSYSSKQAV